MSMRSLFGKKYSGLWFKFVTPDLWCLWWLSLRFRSVWNTFCSWVHKPSLVSSNEDQRRGGVMTKIICFSSLGMMLDGRGYIGISVVLYLKERYAFLVFLFDREYCLRNGIQVNRILRLSRKVCSWYMLHVCWLENSYKQEELGAFIFTYLGYWCMEIRGNDGIGFPTIVVMHQGHCVGQLQVFFADRNEFRTWVLVISSLNLSGNFRPWYYYGLLLDVWGFLRIVLSGEESKDAFSRRFLLYEISFEVMDES